jgi:hypothetical protein
MDYHAAVASAKSKGRKPMTIEWLHDWDEAVGHARKAKKPILIDVYQDN